MRPSLEGLEDRILLYATEGGQWTYGSRITYSFMPDGTSIGGTPSALFQTLNAKYATATWEGQIEQAASIWEAATNINLAQVSDGGEAVGSSGDQQDDPRFGDIRIGAIPLPAGVLAETFLPPPINGGTDAGDILFNSTVNWQIGSNYDLMTVAAHEFGHALGLADTTVTNTVMYGTYSGIDEALASDDIAGIQSLYGTRQYDAFNSNGHRNNFYTTATNITSYITNNQIAIPSLDNTTTSDVEWYSVTVPSTTTGTMAVTVQSSNLSSLAPKLMVYNSSLGLVNSVSALNTFGATITTTTSVTAGQSYYIRVQAAGGPGAVGGYGLLVNFGNQSQAPIPPPNTVVASQPDQGGGSVNNAILGGGSPTTGQGGNSSVGISPLQGSWLALGNLSGWVDSMTVSTAPGPVFPTPTTTTPAPTGASPAGPTSAPAAPPVSPPVLTSAVSGPVVEQGNSTTAVAPPPVITQAVDDVLATWNAHHHKAHSSHHHRRGRI